MELVSKMMFCVGNRVSRRILKNHILDCLLLIQNSQRYSECSATSFHHELESGRDLAIEQRIKGVLNVDQSIVFLHVQLAFP